MCIYIIMKKTIVYIHGYKSKSKIFKSLDKIFNDKDYDRLFFDYSSNESLESILIKLESFIKENSINKSEITFICHSLGGLILNKFLESTELRINKIFYISTPIKSNLKHINKDFQKLSNQSFNFKLSQNIFICSLLNQGQLSSFESYKHLNPALELEDNDGVLTISEMKVESENFYTILGYDHFWILFSKDLKRVVQENI